jgi:hypothetical protein
MPALKSPSVIVLDNVSYYNIKTEETLIREKLSYKIIFQNTAFLFIPLKLKNNFMKKIKFKKPLSVYKTDKIANLLGHEVLRTPVRHCELNPI